MCENSRFCASTKDTLSKLSSCLLVPCLATIKCTVVSGVMTAKMTTVKAHSGWAVRRQIHSMVCAADFVSNMRSAGKVLQGCVAMHADMWVTPKFLSIVRANIRSYISMHVTSAGVPQISDNADIPTHGWWWDREHNATLLAKRKFLARGWAWGLAIGWVDLYYVPRDAWPEFTSALRVFEESHVFNEIAVPSAATMVCGRRSIHMLPLNCLGSCCSQPLPNWPPSNIAQPMLDSTCGHPLRLEKPAHLAALQAAWM